MQFKQGHAASTVGVADLKNRTGQAHSETQARAQRGAMVEEKAPRMIGETKGGFPFLPKIIF